MAAYVADLVLNFTHWRKCDDTQRQRLGSFYTCQPKQSLADRSAVEHASGASPSNEPDLSDLTSFLNSSAACSLSERESRIGLVTLENQSRE